jgi:hypothetical protein
MPLGKNVGKNIKELMADNRKKGSARGAGGKTRSRSQVLAIALSAAGKSSRRYPKTFRIRTS